MKRGSLDLSTLRFVVLDEGDEMLQMGFVDDIEWILTQTPAERQIALFSATMPNAIRRIAQKHLRDRGARSPSASRPAPRRSSASATGWSAACTSSMR